MAKTLHPEYHKALMDEATYPAAKRRIKFAETRQSYTYRTGEFIYVIRKTSTLGSSPALREVYSHEALAVGRRWAPDVYLGVVPIVRKGSGFALGGEGEVVEYALKLKQLSDHYWLHRLIAQEKFTPAAVGRIARFVAEKHLAARGEELPPEVGKPEHLHALAEEVFYQVKKYVNVTVAPAVLDAVTRPMFKFMEDHRKLFARRQKKGLVTNCHGALVPGHIYLKGKDVCAVSPLTGTKKFSQLDVASDLATLLNEFTRLGVGDVEETFLKRYISGSRDRDIVNMLPVYRTLQAMRGGLLYSELLSEGRLSQEQQGETAQMAQSYFQLAVNAAKEIPR